MSHRSISLDLGFAQEALEKPGNQNEPLLSHGLTLVNQVGNPVDLARHLKIGDQLILTIYDLSTLLPFDPVTAMSLKLSFSPARRNSPNSPGVHTAYENFKLFPGLIGEGHSTVFEGHFPNWNAHFCSTFPSYCNNQLQCEKQGVEGSVSLENSGYFYFTALLDVVWASKVETKRTYRTDPEIILSGIGTNECR